MSEAKPWPNSRRMAPRNRPMVIVLGLCAVTIFVTTLFIVIQILRIQIQNMGDVVAPAPEPEAHAPVHHEPPAAPFTQTYELQGMTISLGNRNQTLAAYAEFDLVLDCPSKEAKHWMEINRASIRDAVYEATISFTVEDFGAPEGFARVKKSILAALKSRFGDKAPRDVTLRDWVIR